jgi:hypothetical protein
MDRALRAIQVKVQQKLERHWACGEESPLLMEADFEIRRTLAQLDQDSPKPPIRNSVCRIMVLIAEGGLFD